MNTFKWKDKILGETFSLSCQHQFYKDAEKEEEFLSWAGTRILERTPEYLKEQS